MPSSTGALEVLLGTTPARASRAVVHSLRVVRMLRVFARMLAEDDVTLTEEEKAIARFQKQRMKDLKGGRSQLTWLLPGIVMLQSLALGVHTVNLWCT